MINITMSYCNSAEMNTTNFKRREEDYDFLEIDKALKMNGRYSPFIFKNDYRKSDNCISNVSNCIVLDFDENFTREQFKQTANFAYAIGTTKSHNKEKNGIVCERFRVIIPTETAIYLKSEEFQDLMLAVFRIYPHADTACKDTARAYSGYANAEVEIVMGELFDWEKIYHEYIEEKEVLKRWQSKEQRLKPEVKYDGTKADWYRKNWLNDTMRKSLKVDDKFMPGNRNNAIYTISRYLKDIGLTGSEIQEAVEWVNNGELPDKEIKQVLKGLRIAV